MVKSARVHQAFASHAWALDGLDGVNFGRLSGVRSLSVGIELRLRLTSHRLSAFCERMNCRMTHTGPTGRGRRAEGTVPENPEPDR